MELQSFLTFGFLEWVIEILILWIVEKILLFSLHFPCFWKNLSKYCYNLLKLLIKNAVGFSFNDRKGLPVSFVQDFWLTFSMHFWNWLINQKRLQICFFTPLCLKTPEEDT